MKKTSLILLFLWMMVNQVVAQIQGVVTDAETGEPLPYLNVFYEGKGVGAITDIDGRYTVPKHVEWKKLTFSSVGYETQVILIYNNTQILNVEMKPLDHTLGEVVVRPRKEKYSRKNNRNTAYGFKSVAYGIH